MSHHDGLGNNARTRIQNVTGAQVQALIAKLNVLLPHLPTLPQQELLSNEYFSTGEASNGGGKHVLQETSILSHLRGALTDETSVVIELGAGTARLSDRLQRVTGATLNHILVDRQEFQPNQSRDRAMRTRAKRRPHAVQRVVCDIATFDLAQHCTFDKNCVCMSKHLCGPACDLTISSIGQVPLTLRPPCAVATCCHYLCTWESFEGQKFWMQLGLSKEDFEAAVAASQWASIVKKSKPQEATASEEYENDETWMLPNLHEAAYVASRALEAQEIPPPAMSSTEFERSFSRDEKGALGMKLKQLLDLSRAARMQELGYKVKLVRYTTRSIEDRLLVASIEIL